MNDYFERIEDYLNDRLSPGERADFEAELRRNEALARAVENYPVAGKILDYLREEDLREQLRSLKEERDSIARKERVIFLQRLLAAAAAVLLLITAGAVWFANANYSDASLSNRFFDAPNLSGMKGEEDQTSSAIEAFRASDFQAVIDLLSNVEPADSAYVDAQYLLGFSYLKTGQPQKAADAFQTVIDQGDLRRERAEWHLALAYLQSKQTEKAREILSRLANDTSHSYQGEAAGLLAKLDSGWRRLVF